MPDLGAVRAKLDATDWNFPKTGTRADSVHSFHWFPGNFIPQIPSHLIQILTEPGDLVVDPFAGSGTTAIEAVKLGRRAVCSDIVRACVLIASGKVAGLEFGLARATKDKLLQRLTWPELCETEEVGLAKEGSDDRLGHWYSARTLAQLRYLWHVIEAETGPTRAILELLFSDVLFACASTAGSRTRTGKIRRHHWGWVADNVRPLNQIEHNAVKAFVGRLIEFPDHAGIGTDTRNSAIVTRQDAANLDIPDETVNAVVTSPPYVGVIDYTRANRLLYLWKGWDLDLDRAQEIGARYRRQRNSTVSEYLTSMSACWDEITRVLRPGGYSAIVIGESKKFPGVVTNTLAQLSQRQELIWGPIARRPTRRRVSDSTGSEGLEYLAVYKKP